MAIIFAFSNYLSAVYSDLNSQITKNLKKSSSNQNSIDINKLLRAISTEIDITNERLNLIISNRAETRQKDKFNNPVRKYVFYTNELGQEATWLANDLLRFMPKSAKEQWKGFQHNELQRLLAFYDQYKNDAKNLLSAKRLKHQTNPHLNKKNFSMLKTYIN